MKATVLYDFTSDIDNELTIIAGEILTVTDQNVGNGWWEGVNSKGKKGIFPASYVEEMSQPTRPIAPPSQLYSNDFPSAADDAWNNSASYQAPSYQPQPQNQNYSQQPARYDVANDDYDSDFDDDDYPSPQSTQNQFPVPSYSANLPSTPDDTQSVSSAMAMNRKPSKIFSKSSDAYIMGSSAPNVSESDQVRIFLNDRGFYYWMPNEVYSVEVTSPKMESKFKGIKKFIAYQLQTSFSPEPVSRRYKNFDWLHERLTEKFVLIPIPPLPDKQISGRYEEHFIEHRRAQLQEFVNWVCRHPVLSRCSVWMHFLTSRDQKKWKAGKRTAEKDQLQGPTFCAAITVTPEKSLLPSYTDSQIDSCKTFTTMMDNAVKLLEGACVDQVHKYSNLYRKDYQRLGDCFSELAKALEVDERRCNTGISLAQSVGNTAGIFISIGKLYEDQAKKDWQPFCDTMHVYRGILSSFPDILNEYKNAQQKRKECSKMSQEMKISSLQVTEIQRRVDILTTGILAEQTHFREERDKNLKIAMKQLIQQQVDFHMSLIGKLQQAQKFFE